MSNNLYTVILAAGKGKRMKSDLPKLLHKVGGRSLIEHSLSLSTKIQSDRTIVVVPENHDDMKQAVGAHSGRVIFSVQKKPLGTGHALQTGLSQIKEKSGTVLLLNADMPLVRVESVKRLLRRHCKAGAQISFLTSVVECPLSLGRIVRDKTGQAMRIVEVKDASILERDIKEINVGVYVFELKFLKDYISRLKTQNRQKEYYLTDLIELAYQGGLRVLTGECVSDLEALGVNSQMDLNVLNRIYYQLQREHWMSQGVSIVGDDVLIDGSVKLSPGVQVSAPAYIKGKTKIHPNVLIEPGCYLESSEIQTGSVIHAYSYLEGAKIGPNCHVGPFARLRPGTVLEAHSKIGNFVEVKKSRVGSGSKINHLSYVGDAKIGKGCNIGAGTITCNYDGFKKFQTVLGENVFIGSDTQLVAPLKIGSGAFIGAGSTITANVKKDSLALSRPPQKEVLGWARKKRQKNM